MRLMKLFRGAGLAALMAGSVFAPANAQLARNSTAPIAYDFGSGAYDPDSCTTTMTGGPNFSQETSQLRAQVMRRVDAEIMFQRPPATNPSHPQ